MLEDFDSYERKGMVLTPRSILEQDCVSSDVSIAMSQKLVGVPNFFGIDNLYSFGQPTVQGVENLFATFGKYKLVWINLREEHIIYLNGSPFVLRDAGRPFVDICLLEGMSSESIESLEYRLKADVLEEIKKNNGFVCVHKGTVREQSTKSLLKIDTIMTTKDVFFLMLSKWPTLSYSRIPLQSRRFVSGSNCLSNILNVLERNADENCVFLFNSANGKDLSIFALVLANLFFLRRVGAPLRCKPEKACVFPRATKIPENSGKSSFTELVREIPGETPGIARISETWKNSITDFSRIVRRCLNGEYLFLNNVMWVVDKRSKEHADSLIDKFGNFVNLRKIILCKYIDSFFGNISSDEPVLAFERYVVLIFFAEYCFSGSQIEEADFTSWMASKTAFSNLFEYLMMEKSPEIFFPANILTREPAQIKWIENVALNRHSYTVLIKFDPNKASAYHGRITVTQVPVQQKEPRCVWINIRPEPCLFINGEMFVLKEAIGTQKIWFNRMTAIELESLEIRLKLSVMSELERRGKVLVYRSANEDIKELEIACNKVSGSFDVLTTKDYFEKFGYDASEYFRTPVAENTPLDLNFFDELLKVFSELRGRNVVIHFGDCIRGSFHAAIATDMIFCARLKYKQDPIKFKAIHSVVRLLKYGKESFCWVTFLYEKYVGHSINALDPKSSKMEDVMFNIKMFYLLVCFGSYLMGSRKDTFRAMMRSRMDIVAVYNGISHEECDTAQDSVVGTTKYCEYIKCRSGKVLGYMTILKKDYFLGSIFPSHEEPAEGVRNLRIVSEGNMVLVGLAMPTKSGIFNVLEKVRAMRSGKKIEAVWFCVREEPIVYVNGNPYVLKYATASNENIKTGWIHNDVVEFIENELVEEVLLESKKGGILLHDDVVFDGQIHTMGMFHKVREVESVKSLFESFSSDFKYFRVLVVDERAPIPSVFDFFKAITTSNEHYNVFFFNCQIGKGRTTTSMIIVYLVKNFKCVDYSTLSLHPPKYTMISKLMQILRNPERSKMLTDFTVDKFDHLENLRSVVDKYVSGDCRTLKHGQFLLLRYFYIIVFCEYLLQETGETFCEFLKWNPEVVSLANMIDIINLETVS